MYNPWMYNQDQLLASANPASYNGTFGRSVNNKYRSNGCCGCFEEFKEACLERSHWGMILFTAIVYDHCKTVAVAMTMVSGIWCVDNMKLTLGSGIFVYIGVGVIAAIIGGTLTGFMNWLCLQWMHIIIASCFAIQGAAISLAIKNFDIIGQGGDHRNEVNRFITVNDSI